MQFVTTARRHASISYVCSPQSLTCLTAAALAHAHPARLGALTERAWRPALPAKLPGLDTRAATAAARRRAPQHLTS